MPLPGSIVGESDWGDASFIDPSEMPLFSVSRIARNAIAARLADPATGFNPLFNAALADAGLDIPFGWVYPIDFSDGSTNFIQANVPEEHIDQNDTMTLPLMCAYARRSVNTNLEKFYTFSGPIQFAIKFYASWDRTNPYEEIETTGLCFEETMYGVFNDDAIATWAQEFDNRLVYNGDLQVEPGQISVAQTVLMSYYAVLGLDVHSR